MKMNSLQQKIFYLKNRLFRPQSIRWYEDFLRESELDGEARSALIFSRMRHIVRCAWENSAFYRRKYRAAGLEDGVIRSRADFEQLPPLEKDDLRNYADEIVNNSIPAGCRRLSTTGGSTGIPVKVYHDRRLPLDVVGWHVVRMFGGDISDNAAFLARYNPHKSILPVNQLMWFPTRRCFLDVSLIRPGDWEEYYRRCLKNSPRYLQGYVGAIEEFAGFLSGHSLRLPSLRFVWTTAAPLSESSRAFMENVFNCPVYSQYGCCEIFHLACECVNKEMHYFDTIRHFEAVDPAGRLLPENQSGELLVTDLLNEVFPLIRYRNGDRIRILDRKCSCGSKFPLIDKVQGRTTDVIRFPDGSCVPGDFLTTIFDHAPGAVRQFQVVQHPDCSLTTRYVPASEQSAVVVAECCDRLRRRFSETGLPVNAEAVSGIVNDRGKTRFIVREAEAVGSESAGAAGKG